MSNDIAGNTTDILISGNIKYKDTLFRFIFGAQENRHYLLYYHLTERDIYFYKK